MQILLVCWYVVVVVASHGISHPGIHISGLCQRPLAITAVNLACWNHSYCCHGIEVIAGAVGSESCGSVENRMLTEVKVEI